MARQARGTCSPTGRQRTTAIVPAEVAQLSTHARRSRLRAAGGGGAVAIRAEHSWPTPSPPPAVPMLPAPYAARERRAGVRVGARTPSTPTERTVAAERDHGALAGARRERRLGGRAVAHARRASSSSRRESIRPTPACRRGRSASAAGKVRRADVKGHSVPDPGRAEGRRQARAPAAAGNGGAARHDGSAARKRRGRAALVDRWTLRQGVVRAYERKARPALDVLGRARQSFELIQQLAGPSPRTLRQLQKNVGIASREFALHQAAAGRWTRCTGCLTQCVPDGAARGRRAHERDHGNDMNLGVAGVLGGRRCAACCSIGRAANCSGSWHHRSSDHSTLASSGCCVFRTCRRCTARACADTGRRGAAVRLAARGVRRCSSRRAAPPKRSGGRSRTVLLSASAQPPSCRTS